MFIQVRITTNGERKFVTYPDDTTIRTICEENDIPLGEEITPAYTASGLLFDGVRLKAGDYDKTLAEFGCVEGDTCSLAKLYKY